MKLSARNLVIALGILIVFLTFTGAFFIVNETKQAIVLQFGEPRQVISEPGLSDLNFYLSERKKNMDTNF